MVTKFENHSGGTVTVKHIGRGGWVPESLVEDGRISMSARLIAVWLAMKPAGWQISVPVLCCRVEQGSGKPLGKDRWQAIARELEKYGYLTRSASHGKNGRWIWHITFTPVPASLQAANSTPFDRKDTFASAEQSSSGDTDTGTSTAGPAGAENNGNKDVTSKDLPDQFVGAGNSKKNNLETTTTTSAAAQEIDTNTGSVTGGGSGSDYGMFDALIFERSLKIYAEPIKKLLNSSNIRSVEKGQDLCDELAGAIEAGDRGERERIGYPMAWLKRLIARSSEGDFDENYCLIIQNRRKLKDDQIRQANVEQARGQTSIGLKTLDELRAKLFKSQKGGLKFAP